MDKKDFGWSITMNNMLSRARVTRREMSLMTVFVSVGKDRSAMKTKVSAERKKARNEGIEASLRKAIQCLMAKAEEGRDLGPAGSD